MRRTTSLLLLATLIPSHQARAADPEHPTVVELFQSQGCSSCPPANANVIALADRPDILILTWQVTYWDYLGWKDSFATAAFTERQWDYARGLGHGEVYTPQVVVNGRLDLVGDHRAELDHAVATADRGPAGPAIAFQDQTVRIGPGAGHADIVLVRFDPRTVMVPIGAGENAGRTLPHRNVVKEVRHLGQWAGTPVSFALPTTQQAGLASAILVQAKGGPIIAAQRIGG